MRLFGLRCIQAIPARTQLTRNLMRKLRLSWRQPKQNGDYDGASRATPRKTAIRSGLEAGGEDDAVRRLVCTDIAAGHPVAITIDGTHLNARIVRFAQTVQADVIDHSFR